MRMILFAVLYIIYKLLHFVSFVLFLQRRRFLAILYAFFVYFYVLSKILREFFVQNKTLNTKRRIFLFFFCCQKISLNKPFSPLPSLFCHCALPCSAGKAANRFFTAQHFSLNSAEENSHFAVCFARSRLRTESFFLPNWEFYSGKISRRKLSAQQNISLFSWEENSFFTGIFLSIQQKKTRNLLIIYKEINL